MRHSALFRWIRGLLPAFLITLLLIITTIVVIMISVGFPRPLLNLAEEELARQGIYVKLGRLRLDFFDGLGLVGRNISVYEKPVTQDEAPVAVIGRARLDFSLDSLWTGNPDIKDLKRLDLKGVFISLPVDASDASLIRLDDLAGEVVLQSEGIIDFSRFSWTFEGIDFHVRGRMQYAVATTEEVKGTEEEPSGHEPIEHPGQIAGQGLLDGIFSDIRERNKDISVWLEKFNEVEFSSEPLPLVEVEFDMDVEDWRNTRLGVDLHVKKAEYNGYSFEDFSLETSYQYGVVSIEKLVFRDRFGGLLQWEGSYVLDNGDLSGRLTSSILWEPVRRAFLGGTEWPYGLKFSYPVSLTANVQMKLDTETYDLVDYLVLGEFSSKNVRLAGIDVKQVRSDFSLKEGTYFFDNSRVDFGNGGLAGNALYEKGKLNLTVESDVPLHVYLTLTKEMGAEIVLPEDLNIKGIPYFKTNIEINGLAGEKAGMTAKGWVNVDCESLSYREYGIESFSLMMKADTLHFPGEDKEWKVEDGFFSLKSKNLAVPDLGLKELQISSSFDELTLREEGMLFSMSNGSVEGTCTDLAYNDVEFDQVEVQAYYKDGEGYLPKLALTSGKGQELLAAGKLEGNILTGKLKSSLPLRKIYKLTEHNEAKRHNEKLVLSANGGMDVEVDFRINVDGWDDYLITGSAAGRNATYNGVPVESASASFIYKPKELTLHNVNLVLSYRGYDMLAKTKYSPAPARGTYTAKTIVNDENKSTIRIVGLEARAYPELVVRMFAPNVADEIGKVTFYAPPSISASGIIDLIDERMSNTNLKVEVRGNKAEYPLFGKNFVMSNVSTSIHLNRETLYLNAFKGNIWEGSFSGKLGIKVGKKAGYNGSVAFTNCNLKSLGETLGSTFDYSKVNANLNFDMPDGKITSMGGDGKIELTDGNLLTIPMFGLLTRAYKAIPGINSIPLVNNIADMLIESKINKAQCSFNIEKGKMRSNDFKAKGDNMSIEGVATVDLDKLTLEMNIKVDLKWILGAFMLPLKLITLPFGELLTFHGHGPLESPTWEYDPMSGDYKKK